MMKDKPLISHIFIIRGGEGTKGGGMFLDKVKEVNKTDKGSYLRLLSGCII